MVEVGVEADAVVGNSVVLVVTAQFHVYFCYERTDWQVPICSYPVVYFCETHPQLLFSRLSLDPKITFLALGTVVRESQEIEGFWFPLSPLFPVFFGVPSEFDQPRFLWLKFQAELFESVPHIFQESFCFVFVLEGGH